MTSKYDPSSLAARLLAGEHTEVDADALRVLPEVDPFARTYSDPEGRRRLILGRSEAWTGEALALWFNIVCDKEYPGDFPPAWVDYHPAETDSPIPIERHPMFVFPSGPRRLYVLSILTPEDLEDYRR